MADPDHRSVLYPARLPTFVRLPPPAEVAAERRLTACIHPLLDTAAVLHALEA